MQKVFVALGFSAVIGVVALAAVQMQRPASDTSGLSSQLAAIETSLSGLQADLRTLGDRIHGLEMSVPITVPPDGDEASSGDEAVGAAVPAALTRPDRLKDLVIAAIAEEREIREKQQTEEREKQREEMRQRMETRRQEMEQLAQGPYDRYNVRVNSMGKVLNMTETQKQQYFDLTKAYSDKLQAGRDQLRAQIAAAQPAGEQAPGGQQNPGGRGGRGRMGGEMGQQYRELSETLQKEYETQVLGILTVSQQEVYGELSDRAKSVQSTDMVSAPGEEDPRAGFFGGGNFPGAAGAAPGGFGGGNRGGGRGGR